MMCGFLSESPSHIPNSQLRGEAVVHICLLLIALPPVELGLRADCDGEGRLAPGAGVIHS